MSSAENFMQSAKHYDIEYLGGQLAVFEKEIHTKMYHSTWAPSQDSDRPACASAQLFAGNSQ